MTQIPLLQNSNLASANFSRWAHLDLLLDFEEMDELISFLEPFYLLSNALIADEKEPFLIPKEKFLSVYRHYIHELKNGKAPEVSSFRSYFHLYWTNTLENIGRIELASKHQKLYVPIPTIHTKPICLKLSSVDHSIFVSPLNPSGFLWGLRFSFPNLYQHPGSHQIQNLNPKVNSNAQLFKMLRSWMRKETTPPSFEEGIKVSPGLNLRLGRRCRTWIENHPGNNIGLKIKG